MVNNIIFSVMTPERKDELRLHLAACWLNTYGTLVGFASLVPKLVALADNDVAGVAPGADEDIWVADCDDCMVGSIAAAHRESMIYVWGLYVAPAFQRMRVGSGLLRHALVDSKPDTKVQITVEPQSEKAIAFYAAQGFHRMPYRLVEADDQQFEMIASTDRLIAKLSNTDPALPVRGVLSDSGL